MIDYNLFLTLWDKAVRLPRYDKQEWLKLGEQIIEANRMKSPNNGQAQ